MSEIVRMGTDALTQVGGQVDYRTAFQYLQMKLYFKHMKKDQRIIIYRTKSGSIELRGDVSAETIWATQGQIGELFDIDQSVVSRHINNILKDGEVHRKSNMQKMHNAHSDKPVTLYLLDLILSLEYRANSGRTIQFRQWGTRLLGRRILAYFSLLLSSEGALSDPGVVSK